MRREVMENIVPTGTLMVEEVEETKRNDTRWLKMVAWKNIIDKIDSENQGPSSMENHACLRCVTSHMMLMTWKGVCYN